MNSLFSAIRFLLLLLFAMLPGEFYGTANEVSLVVLQTTDLHGALLPSSTHPGFLNVASILRKEREQAGGPAHTLLIDCGDTIQGSFSASLDRGETMVDSLNRMQYDVWVPGNHDFDYGVSVLLSTLKRIKGHRLAANLTLDREPDVVRSWVMLEKSGLRVAVIGMTSEYLADWIAPSQLAGSSVMPVMKALDEIMPQVMKSRPDVIILAIHAGEFISGRLSGQERGGSLPGQIARKYPQIHLILAGHSHQTVPGKKYGESTWFLQGPPHGGGAAKAEILFDLKKRTVREIRSRICSAQNAAPDAELSQTVQTFQKAVARAGSEQIGFVSEPLVPIRKIGGDNALSSLFGRAIRSGTGADLVLHGTLCDYALEPGPVDAYQLFRLVPYENYLAVLQLNPVQMKQIIEEQYGLKKSNQKSFLHAHGVSFQRKNGRIEGPLCVHGIPWPDDSHKRYSVALGSYALSGAGGRFPVLKKIAAELPPDCKKELSAPTVRDALKSYWKASSQTGKP